MELTPEKIENAFAKVITRYRDADPLTLAEKLRERLEFLMEDADGGIDMRPIRITEPEAEPAPRPVREKSKVIRPAADAQAPPVPSSSIITQVDEAEYAKALEEADPRLRGLAPPKTAHRPARVSSLSQAQTGTAVQYWTVEELVAELTAKTPEKFYFVPNGCDESMQVLAQRNVQPIIMTQGPSVVRLEYANPGVSGDRSSVDTSGQLDEVVLGLTASKIFSLDMADLQLEAVMDEIEASLKGQYAPRAALSEPTGSDPGPIEGMFNMNDPKRRTPMGENFEIHGSPGWRNAGDPSATVMATVRQSNSRYGNR